MSVSLTHVQAALQNHLTNGGSGPLTLNVLHKTDHLVQQLQALNQGKPLSVEVLKSLPNGRAEVLTNGLKLDVKASLPLKTGEVLQLKVEQHGSALRLVQPLGDGNGASKASLSTVQQTGQLAGQQVNSTQTGRAVAQSGAPVVSTAGAPGTAIQNTPNLNSPSLNSPNTSASGQISGQSAQGGQALNSQQANIASQNARFVNTNGGQNLTSQGTIGAQTKTHNQSQTHSQGQLQVQALSHAPKVGQAQAQITASALIGVVADTLPGLAKKLSGRSQSQSHTQGLDKTTGRLSTQVGHPHAGATSIQNQKMAEDVTAKYKTMSSLAVEEIQEVQQKPLSKPFELNLELPMQGVDKPVFVNLQITPDRDEGEEGEERDTYGVKFSLETDDTGPVHASLGLVGKQVRVTLWAERGEFAESLNLHREALDDRLVATGLDVASLRIRRGRPETNLSKAQEHVDAKI